MASPQIENGYIRIANKIWDEIIRRDFTKRQKDILLFLLRLSYGCGKKTAHIPMLKHFALCGVGKTHIKSELEFLVDCRVIEWDKENMIFSFIKDYEKWQISQVRGWNYEEYNELIALNLNERKLPKQEPQSYQNGNIGYQNSNHQVTETVTDQLPKQELQMGKNPCGSMVDRHPKNNIKDNIKNNNTTAAIEGDDEIFRQAQEVERHFLQRRGKGNMVSPSDFAAIRKMLADGIPVDLIKECIDRSFAEFKPKHVRDEIRTITYCIPCCYDEWVKRNTPITDAVPHVSVALGSPKRTKQQIELEELRRKREEARLREQSGSF